MPEARLVSSTNRKVKNSFHDNDQWAENSLKKSLMRVIPSTIPLKIPPKLAGSSTSITSTFEQSAIGKGTFSAASFELGKTSPELGLSSPAGGLAPLGQAINWMRLLNVLKLAYCANVGSRAIVNCVALR